MSEGIVVGINIAPTAGAPTELVSQVKAVPGKGLEGDRNFEGGPQKTLKPDEEITLIEIEAIRALEKSYGVTLAPKDSRRNIITEFVALNHFVDQDFYVGNVKLHGLRLCEPCSHLEGLTQKGVLKGLIHRGGLRAQILTEGNIHVQDKIRL